jgi:hypothetical protein
MQMNMELLPNRGRKYTKKPLAVILSMLDKSDLSQNRTRK